MKKIALSLIAVSALGLAACNKSNTANDAANNLAATANQAVSDIQGATNELRSETANVAAGAQDQLNQAVESTGNVADAASSAVANEAQK